MKVITESSTHKKAKLSLKNFLESFAWKFFMKVITESSTHKKAKFCLKVKTESF